MGHLAWFCPSEALPSRKPGRGRATATLQPVLVSSVIPSISMNTQVLLQSSLSGFSVGITYSQTHRVYLLLCSVLNLGSTRY